MKNIFIINPTAGRGDTLKSIRNILDKKQDFEYEIYVTSKAGDATSYVAKRCEETDEDIRFFSCGGDGTLNEVASGCVGHSNAIVALYPSGSGNDFVKYYGGKDLFLNLDNLIDGEESRIDIIKVGDRYAVNACHFGLDSAVAKKMNEVRHKKFIGGKNAYNTGVLYALFTAMKTKCKVIGDGESLNGDRILLCTIANGKYVGGSYLSAPRSLNDDGYLEVCCIKPVATIKFLRFINVYKSGTHLDREDLKKYIEYRR
ncbi:MAG: hypothetical protein K2N32_02480, partial [Clostridia bacterium]|nr:hypothetical protein [Clostridia bacterium]